MLLLDTNALLWLLNDDVRLSLEARTAIISAAEILVSEVSLWEISIKISIGKLAPVPRLGKVIDDLGFRRLNIKDIHLNNYESLPLLHRDPFDRLLIAQAVAEEATIVTSDKIFKQYGVKIINAGH